MTAVRKRYRRQKGYVQLDKTTKPHSWRARWQDWSQVRIDKKGRTRPAQRSIRLGYKVKGDLETQGDAEAKWESVRSRYIVHKTGFNSPVPTFEEFVWQTYHPIQSAARGWKKSTDRRFRYYMRLVKPALGQKRLSAIKLSDMQALLVDIANKYCHDTANGILVYLRSIFTEALEEDFISKNPARRLRLPPTRERKRPAATIDQVAQLQTVLEGRDLIIFRLLSRSGLRAGEVFGSQWGDLLPDGTLMVSRSFSKGEVGPPKTGTSKKSIVLPASLSADLQTLRAGSVDPSDSGWLFPAIKRGKPTGNPMDSANWLKRVLKPAAEILGFEVTLHMFRRGFATMAHYAGATTKDIQRQLRHANASTTANVYIQPIEESVRQAVEKLDQLITEAASQCGPEKAPS